jgi:hypothetical protein
VVLGAITQAAFCWMPIASGWTELEAFAADGVMGLCHNLRHKKLGDPFCAAAFAAGQFLHPGVGNRRARAQASAQRPKGHVASTHKRCDGRKLKLFVADHPNTALSGQGSSFVRSPISFTRYRRALNRKSITNVLSPTWSSIAPLAGPVPAGQ